MRSMPLSKERGERKFERHSRRNAQRLFARGSEVLFDFHDETGVKDGFIVSAGGGDPLRQHVSAVAPAQRLKSSEQRVTCNAFVSRAIARRTSVCNCNCAVNKKMLVGSTARHTGGANLRSKKWGQCLWFE